MTYEIVRSLKPLRFYVFSGWSIKDHDLYILNFTSTWCKSK